MESPASVDRDRGLDPPPLQIRNRDRNMLIVLALTLAGWAGLLYWIC